MLTSVLVGKAVGGAYFSEKWELRITARCLTEDLGLDAGSDFADIADHPAVRAFVRERSAKTESANWVGPTPRPGQIGVSWVRNGGDRLATIFDERTGVVWLVAYRGKHRSGDPDDAVPYFKGLMRDERISPRSDPDYRRFRAERAAVLSAALMTQGYGLIERARLSGKEERGRIGDRWSTFVAVEVDEGLESVTFAFELERDTNHREIFAFLASLYCDNDWYAVHQMPSGREIVYPEIGWQHNHEV